MRYVLKCLRGHKWQSETLPGNTVPQTPDCPTCGGLYCQATPVLLTAEDVIREAYRTQPHLKLARNREGSCIGAWSDEQQRFVMVAGRTIFDPPTWVSMPYELLINGKPPVDPADWIEVQPC